VGSIHHMLTSQPQAALWDLAERHGPVMLLRLGQVDTVVISSPAAAQEVLQGNDLSFASRPSLVSSEIICYGHLDLAFAPYGDYWRLVRRLVTTHVLSAGKVQSLRRARQEEVALAVAKIRDAASTAVDMTEVFCVFTNDMVCRAVSGKFFRRLEGRHRTCLERGQIHHPSCWNTR